MIAPHLHPGRECSPDCAEYGCASWTGVDPHAAESRKAAERADRVGGITYDGRDATRYSGPIVARRIGP